jgi:arylsulfatase A-like enzyme
MKQIGLISIALLLLASAQRVSAAPPNIVLIYADDLGYGELSCYGMTRLQTPNADRLAREGLRFTDAHASSATCTPSRYSLMTGQYAWRKKGTGILPGDAGLILDNHTNTLPAILQKAGYRTGAVGKWHLGLGGASGPDWNGTITPGPNQTGFDYSFIMAATGDRVPTVYVENGHVVNLDPKDPIKVSYQAPFPGESLGKTDPKSVRMRSRGPEHNNALVNGVPRIGYMTGGKAALWKDEDMADTFTGKAVKFIESQPKDKPFLLYFATHNIHVPRVPNARYVGKSPMGPRGDSIAEFDASVGQVLATLDRLKLTENTLVILTSDNGPVINDGYYDQSIDKLGDHKPAGPYRGGKYTIWEGGTRMPFIVRWPGHVKPGVSSALISQVDLLKSFAALTGQKEGVGDAPDSQNQIAALLGESKDGRRDLVEQAAGQKALALRSGNWKFIPGDKPGLYDLSTDPGETKNIADQNPAKVTEMTARLVALQGR